MGQPAELGSQSINPPSAPPPPAVHNPESKVWGAMNANSSMVGEEVRAWWGGAGWQNQAGGRRGTAAAAHFTPPAGWLVPSAGSQCAFDSTAVQESAQGTAANAPPPPNTPAPPYPHASEHMRREIVEASRRGVVFNNTSGWFCCCGGGAERTGGAARAYARSPRMRRASWMSLGMMVTRLAWMAHRLVSSNRPTR